MTEANLSEEIVEHQLSDETAELDFVALWKSKATRYENNKGDHVDLPIYKEEELQPRRLHKESEPAKKLDEVIEEIRRLMLRSTTEFSSKEKLSEGEPAIVAGKKQQQQQQISGA
jgi:hypothetical protein